MASIIDSFRNTFSEHLSMLKILILTIPFYYAYEVYLKNNQPLTDIYWIVGITLFFLFGVLIKVSNNVISNDNNVLPSFNPFPIAYSAIKGIIAIAPPVLISSFLANYLCSIINISPWVDNTLKFLIWILTASIIISSFLMFAANEKITEAFNIIGLFSKTGDLIFSLLIFIIKLIIMNFLTVCFVGYTIILLFGFGPIFDFFVIFAIIFNLIVIGDYFGQLHYEIIDVPVKKIE
jgi:hypothetical protein